MRLPAGTMIFHVQTLKFGYDAGHRGEAMYPRVYVIVLSQTDDIKDIDQL